VIGVDPGLRRAGWGVIEVDGPRLRHVANGTIVSERGTLAERLMAIHAGLSAMVARHAPDEGALEQTFVNRDGAGSLKLGQARGVALLALAQAGLAVGEYMPNLVKKTVVGTGHAQKAQVVHMVRLQLPGCEPDGEDAADALAVAICHAMHARSPLRAAS
jgi:crossover junction endodeoxyribonuclease RuvC